MTAAGWHEIAGDLISENLGHGVMRLSEAALAEAERSYFYLVQGGEADCLIDGGWGFASDLAAFRGGPDKPLLAIATHSHFDHIGLLHLAEHRVGHAAEADVFAAPDPFATQALPFLKGRVVLADGRSLRPESIRQTPAPLDRHVTDGDSLDLGGRRLTILHTPGHSPGSLTVMDGLGGLLFTADTVHDGHIWDDIPGADRDALLLSHARIGEIAFARACPGHGAILAPAEVGARIERYGCETRR